MQDFADTIFNDTYDEDCSFLSEDEVLDLKHDIAWENISMNYTRKVEALLSLQNLQQLSHYTI